MARSGQGPAQNPLRTLREVGQSVWLDFIERGLLRSGGLARLVADDGISGVTSNPTIFDKAITGGSHYDAQITELVAAGKTTPEIYEAVVVEDIREAADILRPVFDETRGSDGYVSIEVSPLLAHDTEGTMQEVRRWASLINRPNVMVKIPATAEGIPAIEEMIAEGRNINITLIFSLDMYRRVIDAYLRGLERRAASGAPLHQVASVASFFVSRIDTEVDRRLQSRITAAPADSAARPRSRTRSSRISSSARPSPGSGSRRWPVTARACSARYGRARARRIPRTRICCTWRRWWGPTRWTPCRRRPSTRSAIMGGCRPGPSWKASTRPRRRCGRSMPPASHSTM